MKTSPRCNNHVLSFCVITGNGYMDGKELQNFIQELQQARKKGGLVGWNSLSHPSSCFTFIKKRNNVMENFSADLGSCLSWQMQMNWIKFNSNSKISSGVGNLVEIKNKIIRWYILKIRLLKNIALVHKETNGVFTFPTFLLVIKGIFKISAMHLWYGGWNTFLPLGGQ